MQAARTKPYRQLELPLPHRITNPGEYGRALHGRGHPAGAVVTIAQKGPEIIPDERRKSGWKYKWSERAYPVEALPELLPRVAGQEDTYLSMQKFWGWKRIALLASLGAMYVDLDYYRTEHATSSPVHVLQHAMNLLDEEKIPPPSLAISSGQGLYMIWLHGQVPARALPRWSRCQKELHDILKPLGADSGAKDAARVLRIPGTRHRQAETHVEVITPLREVWEFDNLADEILPYTREEYRAEVRDIRAKRAQKAARKPRERRLWTGQGLDRVQLWNDRWIDVLNLVESRILFSPDPDYRRRLLWVAGIGMSYVCVPNAFKRELLMLNRRVGAVPEFQLPSAYNPLFRTLKAAAEGRRVICPMTGKDKDPRFTYRNETLVNVLKIEPEEEQRRDPNTGEYLLRTIISADEERRRDKERKEKARREAGAMERHQYLSRAAQRREDARRMSREGLRTPEIAEALEVSIHTVKGYLYRSM